MPPDLSQSSTPCRAEGPGQGGLLSHFPLQIRGDSPRKRCCSPLALAPPPGSLHPSGGLRPPPKGHRVDRVSAAARGM